MDIGSVYLYKGKPVYITGGEYQGEFGISNWWDFRYVKKDGTLGREGADYDNGVFSSKPIPAKIKIQVELLDHNVGG